MARRAFFRDALSVIIPSGVAAFTATQTPLANAGGSTTTGIIDVGAGRADFAVQIDVTALTVTSDQAYTFVFQGSNSATFASGIQELGRHALGHTSTRNGAGTSLVGRYEQQVSNDINGVEYRYFRTVLVVAGTTPSITLGLWLTNESPLS
jgi:hypothetical protein